MNLTLPEHGIYTVIGPSGSGKSTLLRAIAGLLPGYEGGSCSSMADLFMIRTR
ncbi:ATP-binding cassette domain-containing protein [Paenibacillus rhizoplanae]